MKRLYTALLLCFFSLMLNAQFGGMPKNMKDPKLGRVYGRVIDAKTKLPVEYASVQVLWFSKDSLLGGTLVKSNGDFAVDGLPSFGQVRVRIQFIGYKTYNNKVYIVPPDKIDQDLGDIKLETDEKVLNEVEVTAEKSAVVLSIDKRTYNVDKDLSVKGGTAVDVMKNIPGVTVDADGNAQLRNQAPTIYVDGRPTTLTLQQIPADQIDRVEIITNPSVKYDASATGGILNVVMKKNMKPGYNGMLMAYIGTGDRYGGMGNLNVKEGKWNFSMMYSYNQAINNNQGYTRRTQLDYNTGNTTGYFNQDNLTRMLNQFNFGRFGIDYNINNRNTITISEMVVGGKFNTRDLQTYNLQDSSKVTFVDGTQVNDQHAQFKNFTTQILYKKTWPKAGQELTIDANHNYTDSDNGYLFTATSNSNSPIYITPSYQKNIGYSNSNQYVFQLDYVNPLNDVRKLEYGIKAYYKKSDSQNNTSRATGNEDSYVHDSIMSNHYMIDDMVNAAYINFSDRAFWGFNYQAGLRFEQSYYKGTIVDKKQSFSYSYPSSGNDIMKSLFPGIYLSKKMKKNQEFQINFSRKINRPNFFQLMPFVMFADKQNYRIGNPQLKPEFKNIAEVNYNKIFSKGSYLASGYFRYEEQPITDVAYPDPDPTKTGVLVNTTINGKNSIRYGLENTFKWTFFKNLDVTLNANVFYIYIKGLVVASQPEVKAEGYAYNAKAVLSYKFPKQFTLQVNGNYESPKILLLGYSKPIYSMDVSLNKMIGTKWIFNATLSDAFNTRRMGTHYDTPYYIQDLSRRRETRYVRFTVTYLFGKMDASIFKRGKQMKGMGDGQGSQDGLDFGK
ncbi:MAG: outer membrane beta-barrel protein [Bacteroidetes bacterium]|nr:outer membrane beta-barrel protein [Bacteroidota bacterium]